MNLSIIDLIRIVGVGRRQVLLFLVLLSSVAQAKLPSDCAYGWKAVTGRRTATMAAPMSHCGPVKCEAGLHTFVSICVCLCVKECIQGTVRIEPDNM